MPRRPETGRATKPSRARRVTSVDVARLAGVSRTTVSDVLNRHRIHLYHPDTIERVRGAAAELGYVRSAAGRALVMGRSDFVVVAVPYVTYLRFQDVVEALAGHVEEFGFSAVVHFKGPRETAGSGQTRLLNLVEALRPAGVVDLGGLTEHEAAFIEEGGCPVIPPERPADVNVWIGMLQAEHLYSRGFSRIACAFLVDPRRESYGQTRAAAIADFCESEQLAAPAHVHVPIEPEGARRAVEALVEECGRPMGVACHNDDVAVAVVFAAQRLGLRVPDDVAVIGVEGGGIGQVVVPRLTTVTADVPAAMQYVRYSFAQAYEGLDPPEEFPSLESAFEVAPGETT